MKPNYTSLLATRAYNPNEKPPPDHVVFRIEQRNIGSLGNFIILSGLPKRGKGKFTAGMMASALNNIDVWGMWLRLPENRRRIAFFDTDQSRYDFYKNIELVNKLADIPNIHPKMDAYNVRQDEPAHICNMVDTYLKGNPDCSVIVIDNIGDLLNNFNDEGQSKQLINYFKRITDQKNILIVATLHLGKSNNSTIGHLGAMADRYAQTILTCEKITNQYHLKLKDSRTAGDFSPIAIYYDEYTNEWKQTTAIDSEQSDKVKPIKAKAKDLSSEEHRYKMQLIFSGRDVFLYDELIERVKEYYAAGRNWAVECITHCRTEGIIYRIDEGYTMQKQTRLSILK